MSGTNKKVFQPSKKKKCMDIFPSSNFRGVAFLKRDLAYIDLKPLLPDSKIPNQMHSNRRKRSKSLRTQLFNKTLYDKYKKEEAEYREDMELETMDNQSQLRSEESSKVKNDGPGLLSRLIDLLLNRQRYLNTEDGRHLPILLDSEDPLHLEYTNGKPSGPLIDERTHKPYINNLITSSRYTVYSFFPRQLYAQFSKLANTYFFIVAILQMIPSWSTTGTYTTIIPLCIFMGISMAREAWDDFRRHRLDKEENNKLTKVLLKGHSHADDTQSLYSLPQWNSSTTSTSALNENSSSPHTSDEDDNLDQEDHFTNLNLLRSKFDVHLVKREWKDLRVGDFVFLNQDDWVPADLLVLTCDGENSECFVETMALDGETNLKNKQPHPELHRIMQRASGLANSKAKVTVEDPNIDLYNFEGNLELFTGDSASDSTDRYPLGSDNVLYRGSIVRNSQNVVGMVIFTGEETKIRMNAIKNPRTKAPKLQRRINMIVIFMVFVVAAMALFSFMAQRIIKKNDVDNDRAWYLFQQDAGVAPTVMSFIIMYNTLIPLSLYVTMEIIKVMQSKLMEWDIDIYHAETNTPCESRTATILEELGQVSYIFSDKTGTLTDNKMIFRKFSLCGSSWVHDVSTDSELCKSETEDSKEIDVISLNDRSFLNKLAVADDLHFTKSRKSLGRTSVEYKGSGSATYTGRPSMASYIQEAKRERESFDVQENTRAEHSKPPSDLKSSLELIMYIQQNPQTYFSQKAKFFILSIALCHSCLPKKTQTENLADEDDPIEYQAASPDELALVTAARDMGYVVFNRNANTLTIKTYPDGFEEEPVLEDYEILNYIEFNSNRKRMSVLVRFPQKPDSVLLICKGADNVILERLHNSDLAQQKISELNANTEQRKLEEAELVLQQRKSLERIASRDNTTSGLRHSLSSRPARGSLALHAARKSLSRNTTTHMDPEVQINSIDDFLNNVKLAESEVDEVYAKSRKSLHKQQQDRYNPNSPEISSPTGPSSAALSSGSIRKTPPDLIDHSHDIEEYIGSDSLLQNEEYVIERTLQAIDEFSTDGLRTLLYGYKWISIDKYESWNARYHAAKTSLHNRNKLIDDVGEEIETELSILGATAIEDKLQEGVADAIDKIRRAGIKMWMLTGDKRETAINIGYSCKLIHDYSTVVILSSDDENLASKIAAVSQEITDGNVAHCVVVIDGATLSLFESNPTLMSVFVELCTKTDSVICCRASPSQKALMVSSIRNTDKNLVTLAIGDGANDIAMIQSADIGVGIAGKEGLQASRSSDYSIGQFRFLLKLLLVHGRYNYNRTSKFVLSTFYKELLFYLTQMIFQRYTMFSGTSLYESWSLSMFNTLFTSLPVLCIGMFEKDLKPMTLLAVPELYSMGRLSQCFNAQIFVYWMVLAACGSVLVTFLNCQIWGFTAQSDNSMYPLGLINYTAIVTLINFKCQFLEMRNRNVLAFASVIISVGGWLVWCCFLPGIYGDKPIYGVEFGLYHHFGGDITFWCSIFVLTVLPMMLDIVFQTFKKMLRPTDSDIFAELEQRDEVRKKLELSAFNEMRQGWTWDKDPSTVSRYTDKVMSPLGRTSSHDGIINHTRSRKNTLPGATELPPGTPSKVMVNSSTTFNPEEYEMLPSGKLIKRKRLNVQNSGDDDNDGSSDGNNNNSDTLAQKLGKKLRFKISNKDEDVDAIIAQRMRDLE